MDRDTVYHLALGTVGLSALVGGWPAVASGSPSIASTLWFLGGLGLVATSGYSLLAGAEDAPESPWLYWLVVLGAVLVLIGVVLGQLGV